MIFRDYIRENVIKKTDRILEFGPLTRPLVSKKEYPNTFFADVRSTEDIKKLYTSNDYLKSTGIVVDVDSIVDVDYVVTKSYKETFKDEEKFDVIVLSHVIEHMQDIVDFFQDIPNILKKNGKLIIIYPDANYCFDHFRNGTSFIDAYDVYANKRNNSNGVFDFTFNVVHENNPSLFWDDLNIVDKLLPKNDFKKAMLAYGDAINGDIPGDVHFWPFSDYQFVKFIYDMDRAGLFSFTLDEFYSTQLKTQEFMVVLSMKKDKKIDYQKYKSILNPMNNNSVYADMSNQKEKLQINLNELSAEVANLSTENKKLNAELLSIYNSKRWIMVEKIVQLKNKIIR